MAKYHAAKAVLDAIGAVGEGAVYGRVSDIENIVVEMLRLRWLLLVPPDIRDVIPHKKTKAAAMPQVMKMTLRRDRTY